MYTIEFKTADIIDRLMESPLPMNEDKSLSREEIYEPRICMQNGFEVKVFATAKTFTSKVVEKTLKIINPFASEAKRLDSNF